MTTFLASSLPSERRFGVTFALILAAVGVYGLFQAWTPPTYVMCLLFSITLGVISLAAPRFLVPLNRAWFRFGQLLGKIVNPLVLGVIFFTLLTPMAMVMRLLGRDELRLRRPAVASYWIARGTSCLSTDSFKNQF